MRCTARAPASRRPSLGGEGAGTRRAARTFLYVGFTSGLRQSAVISVSCVRQAEDGEWSGGVTAAMS
jgi:hypothetical protein